MLTDRAYEMYKPHINEENSLINREELGNRE